MRPLRIILAGAFETLAHLADWWLEEVQDKRHPLPKRTYDAPTAKLDGEPLPRPPRVPVVVGGPCTCSGVTYRVAPCAVHPHTSALHTDARHDGGKSGGGNPFGH